MTGFIDLLLVLVLGGALGWLSRRLRFPNAVAQVVLGMVLGAMMLDWVSHGPLLHGLGEIGVVLLLGAAGLETRFKRLAAAGAAGIIVAALGLGLSVTGGYLIGHYFGSPSDEVIYLSLALGATSIGITVQVLQQFGYIGSRVADIIIAAAVIDDVIVLYLLGAAHGLLSDGFRVSEVLRSAFLAIVALGGLFIVARAITRWASHRQVITRRLALGAWVLIAVTVGALVTHALGLSSVVGAFFAGLGTGEGLREEHREVSVVSLRPWVLLFMPFFFVMIGVQAQWGGVDEATILWLIVALVATAISAKTFAGLVGAINVRHWRERLLIGLGMVARGEVALVVGTVGFNHGHMTRTVFDALIITIISVALLGPALMVLLARRPAPQGAAR